MTESPSATSSVNVTDDDDVPVTVSFGSATYNVAEGNTRSPSRWC